ncbi:COMM domain-containing protein 3-like isoform X2 [Watersipora subatra]|uniref:COMM domain-containing protein 3-like isoform X2 n=1 Tax=Watersipora subatra TaxID=2589382 RepID=UPI00355BEDAB
MELGKDTHSESKALTQSAHKNAVFALTSFTADCARLDVSLEEIGAIFEEHRCSPTRVQLYLDAYTKYKDSVRAVLSRVSSFARARIVDVNWRLDYNIKTNQEDKVNQLSYLVNILTQEPGVEEVKTVSFECTLEQLQDLVGKLKDAVRCVEKQVTT